MTALSSLLVLPVEEETERQSLALLATRALCSPAAAVRRVGRAVLAVLLRPPSSPPPKSSAEAPPPLFADGEAMEADGGAAPLPQQLPYSPVDVWLDDVCDGWGAAFSEGEPSEGEAMETEPPTSSPVASRGQITLGHSVRRMPPAACVSALRRT